MLNKTVVLYTKDRAGGRSLSCSLRALDNRVVMLADVRAVLHLLEAGAVDAVLFDYDRVSSLAQLVRAACGRVPFVLLADDWQAACRDQSVRSNCHVQIIGGIGTGRGLERFDPRAVVIALEKLFTDDIFGLAKYLPGFAYEVVDCDVGSDSDHEEIVACVRRYLRAIGTDSSLVGTMGPVVDALISNAVFSAPRDEIRRRRHSTEGQRASTELPPWECPLVQFGSDGETFLFSVTDWFGTLETDNVLPMLVRPSHYEWASPGSARLKLGDILRSVNRLVVNLTPASRTEVIVAAALDPDARSLLRGRTVELYVQGQYGQGSKEPS